MIRLRQAAAVFLLIVSIYFAPLALLSHSSSLSVGSSSEQWEQQQAETVLEARLRRLQQNDFSGSTIPPKFTQLDRAAETQRIYRSVAEERSLTARALSHPTTAWREWLVRHNITYSSRSEADFRRQVWLSNLQRAGRLNEMVGPEVAFGLNRFSGLTPEEFLQQYTGDAQKDSGIRVTPQDPQMLDTPIAPLLANLSAGTYVTPKGEKQNATSPGAGTNVTQPPLTLTPTPPQPGSGDSGGSVTPPGGLTPPIVRPGDGGAGTGTTLPPGGTPPNAGMNPPIVRPGDSTTPGGTPAPGTPGVTPPPGGGLVTPPIITPTPAPGGAVPAPPGTQPTPPGTSPTPPGTVPPQVNPPGVVAPGATTPPPPPGTSPAPAGGTPAGGTPPIVRPPGSIPTVGLPPPATPPPGASPSPPSPPPSPPAPSPAPGAPPAGAPGPSPAPGAAPSPAPGAPPGGVAPIVRPPIGPPPPTPSPPPAGRRRRQLLEMQLQQWVEEQQLQQLQQQLDGSAWKQDGAGVVGEAGRGLRSIGDSWLQLEQQQRHQLPLQSHSQQQQQQQRGHGYYLVLKAMAGAVRQAHLAWSVLLSELLRGSGGDARASADSSDAAVGSTPPWLSDADAGEGEEAVDPTFQLEPHGWQAAEDAAAFLTSSSDSNSDSNSDSGGLWSSVGGFGGRHLQQAFESNTTTCSKQVPWLFGRDRPMASVDWLRQGVVQPGAGEQSNCSNSFAYVTASLAESTMALLGYSGSAKRLSEAQLMACLPGASCSRAGTTHVLLNQLACSGFAAAASGPNAFPISQSWKAAEMPQACSAGDFNPVETGITGWSFVPPSELAFAQALSRTPIKVSVDATMLQSYRAGFIGCNMQSSIANHAMLAVGYSQRVRATEAPGPARGSQRSFTFYTGGAYWMLRNSWGTAGSVDGYVYVAKGCGAGNVAPLGLLANRGVMPVFNSSQTYGVGRLQCYFPGETPDPDCDAKLLLRLSSFCAKVEEFLPLKARTNCSCSCIPV